MASHTTTQCRQELVGLPCLLEFHYRFHGAPEKTKVYISNSLHYNSVVADLARFIDTDTLCVVASHPRRYTD